MIPTSVIPTLVSTITTSIEASSLYLKKHFGQQHRVLQKDSHRDIITKADIDSQNIIVNTLKRELTQLKIPLNNIGFLSEENLFTHAKYTFVIDPIDGTSNFAAGNPYFSISVACFVEGNLLVGAVSHPIQNKLYTAIKGKGSYIMDMKTGRKNRLKLKEKPVIQSLITIDMPSVSSINMYKNSKLEQIHRKVLGVRILGSAALEVCDIAANQLQASIYGKIAIWDVAASKLVINESGGRFVDWSGDDILFDIHEPEKRYKFVAGHSKLSNALVLALNS